MESRRRREKLGEEGSEPQDSGSAAVSGLCVPFRKKEEESRDQGSSPNWGSGRLYLSPCFSLGL